MAQVTVYLPDDVLEAARREAAQKKTSLSAYLCELLTRQTRPRAWPEQLVDLLTRGSGDLVEPEDPPPEDVAFE
jgi:hypothetical protein